jgi:molecular chaperone HtpG
MTEETPTQNQAEALQFQAEVQQLLNILAHSLYTEKEIFLRELISNASDALHRLQFEMLTNRDVLQPEAELGIQIEFDSEAHTLSISDNGIGMTREELIENLGTIAHSGAMAFIRQLEEGQRPTDIIGQFGVGFYSVFMVAKEVIVTSRSYRPDAAAWQWKSKGENTYHLAPAEKETRGTTIEIQLNEAAQEYAASWRLESIIKKHSDFIAFPISVQDRVVNQQAALWRKSPREVEAEDYDSFYRQLTLNPEKPLLNLHMVTDVPVDIHALLFVPRTRDGSILQMRTDHGLKVYIRNVLIQENNKDLLPNHLRFVEGIVDSEDLPLNISRESVQRNPVVRRISKAITGRIHKSLMELGQEDPEEYRVFWEAFGLFIKEGLTIDPTSREDLLPLLRFHSSRSGDNLIDLDKYVAGMKEDQEKIYYVLGEDLETLNRSPHLDYFQANDLEVLYLVDPLDGFMIQSLQTYQEKPLQNVDDAGLSLPEDEGQEDTAIASEDFEGLTTRIKAILGDRVVEVRASKLLRDSPARLVSPEDSPDRDTHRLRRLLEEEFELPPRILELNKGHMLVQNLANLVRDQTDDPRIETVTEQLFDNLLLLEGLHPNPAEMVPRLQILLENAIKN